MILLHLLHTYVKISESKVIRYQQLYYKKLVILPKKYHLLHTCINISYCKVFIRYQQLYYSKQVS